MTWQHGRERSRIPSAIKAEVRERQGNCCNTIDKSVCIGVIEEFDHIVNVASTGYTRAETDAAITAEQIQGLCKPCHNRKTQREAMAARRRKFRKPYAHPGLV